MLITEVIRSICSVCAEMWNKLSGEVSLELGYHLKKELWLKNAESLPSKSSKTTLANR